jgi:hypothetical protein
MHSSAKAVHYHGRNLAYIPGLGPNQKQSVCVHDEAYARFEPAIAAIALGTTSTAVTLSPRHNIGHRKYYRSSFAKFCAPRIQLMVI